MCKHVETRPRTTTIRPEWDTMMVAFQNISAEMWQVCGEAWLDDVAERRLLHIIEEAAREGVWVEVRSYTQ